MGSDFVLPSITSFKFPLTVIAFPLLEKPLCPGISVSCYGIQDPKLHAASLEFPYVGAFFSKDDTNKLKGRELLNQLYEIGSLAFVSFHGVQLVHLASLMRIRIIEMVREDPLTVKVDYLKDKPYDMEDAAIRAAFSEVSLLLRAALKTSYFWKSYVENGHVFSYSHLADHGALIPYVSKHQTQQVIEELDVHKRLKLTLQLAREAIKIIKSEGFMECTFHSLPKGLDLCGAYLYLLTPLGVATTLSCTSERTGLTLYMETTLVMEGEDIGCLKVTGDIGEDTYISACIAYTVARTILSEKQPDNDFFENSMICLRMAKGFGSSAACAITTSFLSLAMKKPVKQDLAMTGAITPTGEVLQIGGVKAKTIGARDSKVKTIIFPEANREDFEELEENLKEGLDVHFVDDYNEIFELAFGYDKEEHIEVRLEDEKEGRDNEKITEVEFALAAESTKGLALYAKITFDEVLEGEGCLLQRGVGKRMQESISIAYTLAEEILLEKQPENMFFADSLLSLHLPSSSINDDTSVGCAILTSFLSLAMNKPVRKDLAMIGTTTLTRKILGIDNVKEKTMAARRSQVKVIIVPEANRRDFEELPESVKQVFEVHFVDEYEQIFKLVFGL